MILSAGLTPAWQQILTFERLALGEVNRTAEALWCASGKVVNAGLAVHHLAAEGLTLAPAGGVPLDAMRRELDDLGVAARWVETQTPTRVCTTLLDRTTGNATELVENARAMTGQELDAYRVAFAEEAARAEAVVLTGSLPSGADCSYYDRLLEGVACPVVCDFRGAGLLAALRHRPFCVKPNREELARTLGRALETERALVAAMQELCNRGARWVVVTDSVRPVWVVSSLRVLRVPVASIAPGEVINPIGCGDAMAGALAVATSRGADIDDAIRLAVAAAAENVRSLLPCRLDPDRVRRLAEGVRVQTVDG